MQHTPTPVEQVKISALELIDFVEIETLEQLHQIALTSQESKNWDPLEKFDFKTMIRQLSWFLRDLKILNERNLKVNMINPFADYDEAAKYLSVNQLLILVKRIFYNNLPKKIVWDLMTLFVASIDSDFCRKNNLEFAGIAFSVKLLSQFLRDVEYLLPITENEISYLDLNIFYPIVLN